MNSFVEFSNASIDMHDVPNKNFMNADETNVPFLLNLNTAHSKTNSSIVGSKKVSTSKCAKALLGVSLSGTKLPLA